MRYFLLLIVLLFCTFISTAQELAVARLCRAERGYILLVDSDAPIQINPSHSPQLEDFEAPYRFFVPLNNEWLEIRQLLLPVQPVIMLDLTNASDCSEESSASIPMNECLGLAPASLDLPNTGVFTIDGNEYHYADNLSFLVPSDVAWQWDLYVEGRFILHFEQDAEQACHITEAN